MSSSTVTRKKQGPMTTAREEIAALKREVAHWKKLAEPAVTKDASNVVLVETIGNNRNLPPDPKIGFAIGGDLLKIGNTQRSIHRGTVVEAYWPDNGQLAVLPASGNVVYLIIMEK